MREDLTTVGLLEGDDESNNVTQNARQKLATEFPGLRNRS